MNAESLKNETLMIKKYMFLAATLVGR